MRSTVRNWRRRQRYRKMVRELTALSPRQLRVLGILPQDISRLSDEASRL
jgi:uncharacterized protein YjiS (DUF1127 family)